MEIMKQEHAASAARVRTRKTIMYLPSPGLTLGWGWRPTVISEGGVGEYAPPKTVRANRAVKHWVRPFW